MWKVSIAILLIALSGCDNESKHSAQTEQRLKNINEKAKFDCKHGSVSTECLITSGDQLGTGKWRHARMNISGSDASLNMDDKMFIQTDVNSWFLDGSRVTIHKLKSTSNSTAEIRIDKSNAETTLSVDVKNADNKLVMTAYR